jgi:hypothetical protein
METRSNLHTLAFPGIEHFLSSPAAPLKREITNKDAPICISKYVPKGSIQLDKLELQIKVQAAQAWHLRQSAVLAP